MATRPPEPAPGETGPFTRWSALSVRLLLGLLFLVSGLNGFLNFLPQPAEPMPEGALALMDAMLKSRYLFPLVMGTQLAVSVLLLVNRFVPLALALLAPVVVNIVAFHLFLARAGLGVALVVLVLHLYLAWVYRRAYATMLGPRFKP